ncbi:MAG: FAD-dependent monooxygenase [bacterium]|nr:FAD-dependent monooxygenase [bacterium]
MRILIIGGGVAGLALVGCLKKQGFTDITLVERAPQFHNMGFLIGFWENGRRVMRYLGIDHITEKKGYEVKQSVILNKEGRFLKSVSLNLPGVLGLTVTVPRVDLHEGLLSLLPGVEVKLNTVFTNITQQNDSVEVSFSDGTKGTFDIVVGADGIHSQVREQIFGKDLLKHYGSGVWAYWLPNSFTYPALPTQLLGDGKACFVLPSHNSSTVSFIAHTPPGTRFQGDRRTQLRELFRDFQGLAKAALEVAPPSNEIWYDDISFVRMPTWYTGRIVLIGDAQHAVSPLVGMGSSMAMEDAYVLAEELGKHTDNIEIALEQFKERRNRRMKKFLFLVNRIDGWFRAKGLLAKFRNWTVTFIPDSRADKILGELLESDV